MGPKMTHKAKEGFAVFLNYVGGSYIYVRVKFAERIQILTSSWATASKKAVDEVAKGDAEEGASEEGYSGASGEFGKKAKKTGVPASKGVETKKSKGKWFTGKKGSPRGEASKGGTQSSGSEGSNDFRNTSVPTTYNEMFMFNAAVMGFGAQNWMHEVLASFDTIVTNVSNSYRLQEECDVLSLRLAKYRGSINLGEYKAVMLASLRSLCKDWGSQHEVSWSWLWENVERMLNTLLGKPAAQEKALSAFFSSLDENSYGIIRREIYAKFFAIAPAGQDYFKQSTTRLHFISDRIVMMTQDIFKDPKRMVEDISALGLRHVGYGIPTDLFGPFVTACVQVIRTLTEDDAAEEAFRWSLSLVSRILTRVINEGSTIVMKAINANSGKQLRRAVGCAPRGKRALWMLNIQVGTQSISPLMWAIETGSLDAAKSIITDLLIIRADRDRYYYGMDILFERHPYVIKRLCMDAPALMTTLLDGLIWRSRTTENGQRRVNYYIRHLVMDENNTFAKAIEWITENQDPKLVCHPVVSLVTDMVWGRVAFRTFLFGRAWFLFTLLIFITSQSMLHRVSSIDAKSVRNLVFALRCFIYVCSMGHWIVYHVKHTVHDVRNRALVRVGRVWIPEYLAQWQGWSSLILTMFLVAMLIMEPILQCIGGSGGDLFTQLCKNGHDLSFPYSIASAGAMLIYFMLLTDLSVFSTRVSAFALVCSRVLSEVALFLFGITFFVATFACAISALEQDNADFGGIPEAALQLYKIAFGMFSGYEELEEDIALDVLVFVYVLTTIIFMLNLLIAQLNCAYQATYPDMLGYARLNRGKIVYETMPSCPKVRWAAFVGALRLDECCEFGEGDMGVPGGVQVFEPASANLTTVDMIRRFGGSTSPAAQWPEVENTGDDDDDRFDRMEKLIEKAMKRMSGGKGGRKSTGATNSSMSEEHLSSSGSVAVGEDSSE